MKQYKWKIVLLNLILILGYFNYSIYKKEQTLREGQLILLELAPVDPRSIMQGDYMDLRYDIAETRGMDSIPDRGFCVVRLNDGVAERIRFQEDKTPLNEGEYLIECTRRKWRVFLGTESFFFQEGKAEVYQEAKYGGLRVDPSGKTILVGLYDKNKVYLE